MPTLMGKCWQIRPNSTIYLTYLLLQCRLSSSPVLNFAGVSRLGSYFFPHPHSLTSYYLPTTKEPYEHLEIQVGGLSHLLNRLGDFFQWHHRESPVLHFLTYQLLPRPLIASLLLHWPTGLFLEVTKHISIPGVAFLQNLSWGKGFKAAYDRAPHTHFLSVFVHSHHSYNYGPLNLLCLPLHLR